MSSHICCFVDRCEAKFESAEIYINHLKDDHLLPNNHRCICTVGKCTQIFQKFYSFKRHILSHASTLQQLPRQTQQDIKYQDCAKPVDQHSSQPPNETHQPDTFMIESLSKVDKSVVQFSLGLHKRPNLTRNDVKEIQNGAQNVFAEIAKRIEELELISSNPDLNYQLHHYLQKLKHTFDTIDTDYKLFKHLEKLNIFRKPQIISVEKETSKISVVTNEYLVKSSFLILMPTAFQIKTFFEMDDALEKTLKHIEELEKMDRIGNFINGRVWKDIRRKYGTELLIPISLYADEFEVNDTLSSHNKRHSVCGVYYSFPVIAKEFSSKLHNIFIAGMVKKVDINEVGINKLMQKLITTFEEIESNGIVIKSNGKEVTVRFVLSLFLGDNLGVHSFLLFSGSFSATYYCRFCRRSKHDLQKDENLHSDYLRNQENYLIDAQLENQALTGIKGMSIFNQLPSFNVVKNISVDPMHDLFSSGVCKYGLTEVLNYCIYKMNFASLSDVNTRRRMISRAESDEALSRMPDLEESYIKTKKSKSVIIRTTASEMKSFCFFITFILGPFFPENDPVWEFCKTLVSLVDFSLLPSFSDTVQQYYFEAPKVV